MRQCHQDGLPQSAGDPDDEDEDRTDRGATGNAEQIRIGQVITRQGLQYRSTHRQQSAHSHCANDARGAQLPDNPIVKDGDIRAINESKSSSNHPNHIVNRHMDCPNSQYDQGTGNEGSTKKGSQQPVT